MPSQYKISSCHKFFLKWKESSKSFYKTNWFSILFNKDYHVLEYSTQQVVVLPIVEKANILLVKVKRPVIGCSTWELPAGGLEKDEEPKSGGLRELKEETGISIKDMSRLCLMNTLVVSPTRMPMFPNLFSIKITKQEYELRQSHDDEIEKVGLFSFDEIRKMVLDEKIFVSLPLAILSRFLLSQEK
tara:strand:+ start:200 stop:760 length:561 start_codon:yes stop_codon:yes gene_type:complete